jgi:hypothetical protein
MTLAELIDAANHVEAARWARTATLTASVAQMLGNRKATPDDFNPYARPRSDQVVADPAGGVLEAMRRRDPTALAASSRRWRDLVRAARDDGGMSPDEAAARDGRS